MRQNILKSIKLTLAFCAVLTVGYVLILWLFALVAGPGHGRAEKVEMDGKVVGAACVGQSFMDSCYFWGRPSAVGYKADGSGGSNKGPSNEEYLSEVASRIDSFLAAHPYLERSEVPAELVTASGSGLDPDISPEAARVQVRRVAEARGIPVAQVEKILEERLQDPFLGLFGPSKVNVLELNVALDKALRNEDR